MADARRFDVRNELGKGAFGAVYLADLTSSSGFAKLVALKVLHAEWSQNPDMAVRLAEEARLLGRLRHPNIVAVDDLVQVDGQWAVVMEYIPGADVEAIVHRANEERSPVPLAVVVGIVEGVARALDAAWSSVGRDGAPLNVVHRDIEPSNIRVTPDGAVKVLDFGIAASPERDAARAGSPAYMSPERLAGVGDGPEGDVYAVGATLFELLSGDLFGRAVGDRRAHEARVAEARGRVLALRGPAAEVIADLLVRCLAYEPEERPTARVLADAARALSRTTLDGDLVAWARGFVTDTSATTPRTNLTLIGNVGAAQTLLFTDLGEDGVGSQRRDEAEGGGGGAAPGEAPSSVRADRNAVAATPATTLDAVQTDPRGTASAPLERPNAVVHRDPAVRWWLPATAVAVAAFGIVFVFRGGIDPVAAPAPHVGAPSTISAPPAGSPPEPTSAPSEVSPVAAPPVAAASGPAPLAAPSPTSSAAARTAHVPASSRPVPVSEPRPVGTASGASVPSPTTMAGAVAPSSVPRIRTVKFSVPGAEHVTARCGDVTEEGPSSANLRGVVPGTCQVIALVGGVQLRGTVAIDAPRLVLCTPADGGLSCS